MKPAVVFDGVWKKFHRGERQDSLRDLVPALARRLARPRPVADLHDQEFWALRDVSFEVHRGDALGIIGPNGAGKSTALKLLTRILKPTRGSAAVTGRVGALIEVAAGFHPDLTGRENVYLQGAIMGMKRAEIARHFDAIVDFAGVGQFIDTPVKRYSSGMNARLGFSIAAHLEPDVLLIDEVLSVGDAAFQARCQLRMREFRARGAAIVFVSHNLRAIIELCGSALLLDRGSVGAIGPAVEVVSKYCATDSARATGTGARLSVHARSAPAGGPWVVAAGERIDLSVDVEFLTAAERASVGVVVWDMTRNLYVYGASSDAVGDEPIRAQAGQRVSLDFTFFAHLTRGAYAIEVNVFDAHRQARLAAVMPAKHFTVSETASYDGVANLYLESTKRNTLELSA
jgi:lipopolysaccharide transport system ATP-binding protein